MRIYIICTLCAVFISLFAEKSKSMYELKEKTINKPRCLSFNIKINKKKMKRMFIIFLASLPFILVASLRYYVGTDYAVYSSKQIPEVLAGIYDRVELLYRWIILFGVNVLKSYQWVFAITAILFISFLFIHIYDFSCNIAFSVFLVMSSTFFNYSLNIMRQSLATVIFLFAIRYILNHNWKRYYFWIIIASLIHTSAIIYLPLYFVRRIKIKTSLYFILPTIGYIFADVFRNFLIYLCSILGIYTKYFGGKFDYSKDQTTFLVLYIIVMLVGLSIKKNTKCKEKEEEVLEIFEKINIIGLIITSISSIIPNSTRIIYMFLPIQITLLPMYIERLKNPKLKILIYGFFVSVYAYLFYKLIIVLNFGETLPYQSIIFK